MEFVPANDLEAALLQAQRNEISIADFAKKLIEAELALPSGQEVLADGSGFQPVLFERNGVHMVAAFTDKQRIHITQCRTLFCLTMKALDLLKRLPKDYGIVLNPGLEVGLEISPQGIREIVKDFA